MTALPASTPNRHGIGPTVALLQRLPLNYTAFGLAAIPSDVTAVLLAALVTAAAYDWIAFGQLQSLRDPFQLGAILAVFTAILLHLKGHYAPDGLLPAKSPVTAITGAWALALLSVFALSIDLNAIHLFFHGWVPSFAIAAPALTLAHRLFLHRLLATALDRGWLQCRHVVVISDTTQSSESGSADRFHKVLWTCLLPRDAERVPDLLQRIASALPGEARVDEIHLAINWGNWLRAKSTLGELRALPIPVRLIADATAIEILRYPQQKLRGTVSFELQRAPLTAGARTAKRVFDLIGASVGLLLLAPVLLAIAVAIRSDSPGPFLFKQKRGGFNGRVFPIFKFRTMRVLEDGPSITQATREDDRVTRVGRFLRHTSLDELPQLLNVLRGEMSLVGPRPHALAHDAAYRSLISAYPFRQYVKPGITGWAQVNGFRGETPTLECMKRRVDLDLWYACNWSFWLDLRILLGTVWEVCRARNAF